MSNKIDATHNGLVDKTGSKTDQKVTGSGRASTVQPGGSAASGKGADKTALSDTVVLTERSQLLERLDKIAAKMPAIDPARVAAVKADIASGNYQIDVDNIAEILLRSDQELGG